MFSLFKKEKETKEETELTDLVKVGTLIITLLFSIIPITLTTIFWKVNWLLFQHGFLP